MWVCGGGGCIIEIIEMLYNLTCPGGFKYLSSVEIYLVNWAYLWFQRGRSIRIKYNKKINGGDGMLNKHSELLNPIELSMTARANRQL